MLLLLLSTISYLMSFVRAQGGYYMLQDSFQGGPTFFDNFNFWTSWDPTFGFVHYVDQDVATQYNMITITNSTVSWGVDTTQILDPDANLGRLSIRLTSVQTYTHGLFVLDLAHMPDAVCGSWPSFWSLGASGTWPSSGMFCEIDIIEGVNQESNNLMSLHTMPGCSIAGADESGTLLSSDCGLGGGFAGCTVQATTPSNFGSNFNANGGGVYAMEWTSLAIQIWFFPRDAIPATLSTPYPDVSSFGEPMANFEGSCDIDTYFYDHNLIFDVDFCGSWAGPTFQTDGCPALDPGNSWTSCNEFVALNPGAFTETYWEVNYLDVYQLIPGTAPTTTSSLSSVTPAISTSSAVSTALSGAQGRSTTPTVSIAGTTPNVTSGTFTATSSVLSVLSLLSASSVSASLVGASTSSSSPITSSLSTTSTVPSNIPTTTSFASATTTDVPITPSSPLTSSTFPPTANTMTPLQAPPIATTSPSTVICIGYLCTSYTTALVIETVTVNVLIAAAEVQNALISFSEPTMAFSTGDIPSSSMGEVPTLAPHANAGVKLGSSGVTVLVSTIIIALAVSIAQPLW